MAVNTGLAQLRRLRCYLTVIDLYNLVLPVACRLGNQFHPVVFACCFETDKRRLHSNYLSTRAPKWCLQCEWYDTVVEDSIPPTDVMIIYMLLYPDELVPEETFTQSFPSSSSTVLINFFHLSVIHSIHPVQSACLSVFLHNPLQVFFRYTSGSGTLHFILRTFLHPVIIFFFQHVLIPLRPVLL